MRSSPGSIVLPGGCLGRVIGLAVDRLPSLAASLPFILALALSLLLLLPLLPFLSDLLELCMFVLVKGAKEFTSETQHEIASTPTIRLMLCNPTKHHDPNRKRDFATTKTPNVPSGVRLFPCDCIVTCAFKWFNVPYAFSHPCHPHLYMRSISS